MTTHKDKKLKAFVIFLNDGTKAIEPQLTLIAQKEKADEVALTYLSKSDKAVGAYKVNLDPEVKNTIIVHQTRRSRAKFVNLKADEKGLGELNSGDHRGHSISPLKIAPPSGGRFSVWALPHRRGGTTETGHAVRSFWRSDVYLEKVRGNRSLVPSGRLGF